MADEYWTSLILDIEYLLAQHFPVLAQCSPASCWSISGEIDMKAQILIHWLDFKGFQWDTQINVLPRHLHMSTENWNKYLYPLSCIGNVVHNRKSCPNSYILIFVKREIFWLTSKPHMSYCIMGIIAWMYLFKASLGKYLCNGGLLPGYEWHQS